MNCLGYELRMQVQPLPRRSDPGALVDQQIEQWAHALADRLEAAGVVAGADIDVQIRAA
jgi:hypothetical protein